ncbi:MAG TPA: bacillithiol biosynthesis BshC, partial [bacterium]|nr:bacillithiol biosynthesis BshC [bacterium]
GPSEIAYHAQLAGEYELLGVTMPVLFPRFAATLVPAGVRELAERRREPLESFVRDFDETMRRTADRAMPEPAREAMERLDHGVEQAFESARTAAAAIDPKLDDAFRDAARRAREAAGKARDKVIAAVRAAETRRDPAVKSYREFLRPRGVPQERVLSGLTLFLESEAHPLDCLAPGLEAHLDAVRERTALHWLIDFGGCRDEPEPGGAE